MGNADNIYAPFCSKMDWEIARWAKVHGPSSTAVSELLAIDGLSKKLSLSYKNARELNVIFDSKLPRRPPFQSHSIEIAGETVMVYTRNIISCIKALYGDAAFAPHLIFRPERHYEKFGTRRCRLYHDMHTADWWWEIQTILEASKPGATVIPLLVSTDRTQVTLFGNKTAYPLYLTIGNIPKDIRCKPSCYAQIVLAYLPTSYLKHVTNDASRRRMVNNLFHSCLGQILEPIRQAAVEGVLMKDGRGVLRRCHPILASYIADYPEQVLVTGTKTKDCPKCNISAKKMGDLSATYQLRDIQAILNALTLVNSDPRSFRETCNNLRIKPIFHPFFERLPYVNIYQAITPDILHQLHQGVLRHLLSWLVLAYGASEINARCMRIIPNHHIRIFSSGITGLSRLTGKERDLIGRIILGVIFGARLLNDLDPSRVVRAIRGFLDFLYLARLPIQSSKTLDLLERALQAFHDNINIFVDLGIRKNFNIPKLHACRHYKPSIKLFGSTDNYDTQYTEGLHKTFSKDPYRGTNKKDELPQMTALLERQEQVHQHTGYIHWREQGTIQTSKRDPIPTLTPRRRIKMTKRPSARSVSIEQLEADYGVSQFRDAFARFVIQWRQPTIRQAHLNYEVQGIHLPFVSVSTYHRIKFQQASANGDRESVADIIHAQPAAINAHHNLSLKAIHGRFDTVLVHNGKEGDIGIRAHRVAQVRAVFSISPMAKKLLFPTNNEPPEHLAYIEWFTPFQPRPEPNSRLYKVSRAHRGDARMASIIPVGNITQSIHLIPLVGSTMPRNLNSLTVLDHCQSFLVNSFMNTDTYLMFNE
ncbi:hypothetical protein AX14_012641 [Amanita brunnescens Koide BX004]|nr:hypothetical protein AX14_012641 [Amanita brunnescens Koide BX004]